MNPRPLLAAEDLDVRYQGKRVLEVERLTRQGRLNEFDRENIELLDGGIYYVNLDLATPEGIDSVMDELAVARGVIFDLRGYPAGNHRVISHHSRRCPCRPPISPARPANMPTVLGMVRPNRIEDTICSSGARTITGRKTPRAVIAIPATRVRAKPKRWAMRPIIAGAVAANKPMIVQCTPPTAMPRSSPRAR